MDGVEALRAGKRALRQQVRLSRSGRDQAQRRADETSIATTALGLPALREASTVAVYASLPDEPATGELRQALRALGTTVLLPVIRQDGSRVLDWAVDAGELTETGQLRLPEPTGERLGPDAIARAGVLVIPAMAVDGTGLRLGRGRGYYDATLAGIGPHQLVLALVHDDELVEQVPAEAHDRRVHGVLTPTRLELVSPRG